MTTVTRWWWIRHAPVTVNNGCIYGQTDLPCDCSSDAAFGGLAARLPRDAVWVTSNLKRTHQTAAGIVRAGLPGPDPIPGPGVIVEPDLAEQSFGEWHGMPYEELKASRAEQWQWGSLWRWASGNAEEKALLSAWPLPRRPGWIGHVNTPQHEREVKAIRHSIQRGTPYGDSGWIERTVRKLQLETTLRPRGRPRKEQRTRHTVPDTFSSSHLFFAPEKK